MALNAVSILFLLSTALWAPASFAAKPDVQYVDGRLTADLRDVPLADVLGAIMSQAALEIRGEPPSRSITVRLDAVPLAEALPRLLEGQSFALTYDRKGGLKGVRFLAASTAEPWHPSTIEQQAEAPVEPSGDPSDTGHPGFPATSNRLVPIDGLLAEALGAEQSTFYQIMGVALQVGDSRLRQEALVACLRILDADDELRSDILQRLDGLDDAYLADWLTRVAGANAEEVARGTARLTRSRPLRKRAVKVGRILETSDPSRPPG